MSTTPKYSRLDPAQRRDQILDAANALFAERGYDEVSVEDIASAAGVARGLVHHYFGGRKEVYIALLERLGTMREEQLPPPVGRSARARLADDVSRWLDWTEQNRTIWLGTIAHGEDIADPDVRRVVDRPRAPRRRAGRGSPRRHRRGLAAAALRARVLDRTQPRRHPPLATRRGHPRADARAARLDTRARPTHLRHPTQAKPAHSPSLRSIVHEDPTSTGVGTVAADDRPRRIPPGGSPRKNSKILRKAAIPLWKAVSWVPGSGPSAPIFGPRASVSAPGRQFRRGRWRRCQAIVGGRVLRPPPRLQGHPTRWDDCTKP